MRAEGGRIVTPLWRVGGNNSYTREMALDALGSGAADLVAFGKPFIANPDLGLRLRREAS